MDPPPSSSSMRTAEKRCRYVAVFDYNKLPSWAKPLAKGDMTFKMPSKAQPTKPDAHCLSAFVIVYGLVRKAKLS